MESRQNTNKTGRMIRRDIFICLFLIFATSAVYWQVSGYDFISLDDGEYVHDNYYVRSGITKESITWAFTKFHSNNWHPLAWISLMIDCHLFGVDAKAHHVVNLLFHILNSLLLFMVFRMMTGAVWKSAFVAALFALHPMHVESVAWISERKDVLSVFFMMLTLLSYYKYTQNIEVKRYVPVVVFFVLGLLAKPMLVTLPFVLLLLDVWPISRMQYGNLFKINNTNKKRMQLSFLLLEKTPLFFLSAASSIVTFLAQKKGGIVVPLQVLPFEMRIQNAIVSYIRYIEKMVWPSKLAFYYPYQDVHVWHVAGSMILIISITFLAVKLIKNNPFLFVGWFWYIGTLVPVIGLIQVASQSMADRYTYVPYIGLFIIAAWGIPGCIKGMGNRLKILTTVSATLFFGLMVCTWMQLRYWENSSTLYQRTINVTVNNLFANLNLGAVFLGQKKYDEAIDQYLEATRIDPNYSKTYNLLGRTYAAKENYRKAIEYFNKAIQMGENSAESYFFMARALMMQRKVDEAVAYYLKSIEIKKDYAESYNELGRALLFQEKIDEAKENVIIALRIEPNFPEAHYNLGLVFESEEIFEKAIQHYSEAIRIKPDYDLPYYKLGYIYLQKEKIDEAVNFYLKLIKINPDSARAYSMLGRAFIERGDVNEAKHNLFKALQIEPNLAEAHYHLGMAKEDEGRIDDAVKKYFKVIQLEKDFAPVHNRLGDIMMRQGNAEDAARHYLQYLKAKPEDIRARNNLGISLAIAGKTNEAIKHFLAIIRIDPDTSPSVYYNLAGMYSRLNKVDESIKWLKLAIEKGYTNWDLIQTDKDLDNIRDTLDYRKIIQKR